MFGERRLVDTPTDRGSAYWLDLTMTFCVLLDTSHTMGEQGSSANGMSKLDIGKSVVESLLSSVRKSKSPLNPQLAQVSLLVLTPGDDYNCIVSYVGDPPQIADSLIKNVACTDDSTRLSNISFPISQAISITNKYRMRNNIDTFGFGRYPVAVDPLKVFVITDGVNIMRSSEHIIQSFSSSAVSTGNDFAEPLRWDQQFYVVLVKRDARCDLPRDLLKLCEDSCGGVLEIGGVEDIKSKVVGALVPKAMTASVGVVLHDERDACIVHARVVVARETADWPVPEAYVYKKSMNKLPCRRPYPDLCILGDQTIDYSHVAESADISFDSYEVTCGLSPASLCASFALNQTNSYAVVVICTEDDDASTRSFTKRTEKHSLQAPFGILKYKKETGSMVLTLLPYNFPVLLPVLKEGLKKVKTAASNAWAQGWRREFENYLSSVPPNYHQSLLNLLVRTGLKPIYHQGSLSSPEFALNPLITKKIDVSRGVAAADIAALERAGCDRWVHSMKPRPEDLIFREHQLHFPRSASDVKTSHLLAEWEVMRSAIYGGPLALTLRGLSAARAGGAGGRVLGCSAAGNSLFQRACGGEGAALSIDDAGDYQSVLALRERFRDPLLLVPPDDEDTPMGVMRRKFDVNFGSKFKKARGGSDEREPSHEELFMDSPVPSPRRVAGQLDDRQQGGGGRAKKAKMVLELFPKKSSKLTSSALSSRGGRGDTAGTPESAPDPDPHGPSPVLDAADVTMASEPNLPAGWKKLYSRRESRHYYFNKDTGESSWILSTIAGAPTEGAAAAAQREADLPAGWRACFSKREGRVYYYHAASKCSSWEVPS